MSLIVAKFGGTSVANFSGIKVIESIVRERPEIKVVIVSALGKDKSHLLKVTDQLIYAYNEFKLGQNYKKVIFYVVKRYKELANNLSVEFDGRQEFLEILNEFRQNKSRSYLISRGEYLCGKIVAKAIGADFIDSKDIIIFNKNKKISISKTESALKEQTNGKNLVVIPGFYGGTTEGNICTFLRGGSDITGAIVSKCLNADMYENWTDVDGVYDKDPNRFPDAKIIRKLKYSEAKEIMDKGAKILNKKCFNYLNNTNIKVTIKNTFNRFDEGSIIE